MFQIIKEVGIANFIMAGVKEIYRKIYLEKMFNSYSQNGEDLIVEKLLDKENGFYLEIGAYHPTRLSNTYRFYKKGWTGVVVEPNPEVKKIFEMIRPNDRFINVGVGEKTGELNYFQYLIPALNTFSEKQVKENKLKSYKVYKVNKVKVITINELLKIYVKRQIDFLSLDVEGWDKEILANWDWKYKPKIICVEDNELKINGYKLKERTKNNSIFILED